MDTGTRISVIAHLMLIGWVMFGAAFDPEPLPFEVREVSLVSAREYAALTASPQIPEVAEQPAAPAQPETVTEPPPAAAQPDPQPEQVRPEPTPEPQAEAAPERIPEPPVSEPVLPDPAPALKPPAPQVAALPPEPRPQPRPVERVAPQPVAPPPPEARPDEVSNPEIVPEQGAETPTVPQAATAPPEATDRIVTEAEQGKELAPSRSKRPQSRPARPAVAAARPGPAPRPAAEPDTRAAVDNALAEALGGPPGAAPAQAEIASGPPMTEAEKDVLRLAVQKCWNVGSLSSAALATTVVVAMTMAQDGKPEPGSIQLLSSSGGAGDSAKQAFDAARRAIIRCGASGFDLPAEKYGQWRDIEMTFNPERMRVK